jgi:hypothetical protein
MKSFKVWVESRFIKKKELINSLVRNLEYEPNTLETQDIKLSVIPKRKIRMAIDKLPVDEEEKEKLKKFVMTHPRESLRTLANQIDPLSIEEKQDKAFTYPAQIPPEQQPAPRPPQIGQ